MLRKALIGIAFLLPVAGGAALAQNNSPSGIGAYPAPPLSGTPAQPTSPGLRYGPVLEERRREICRDNPGACGPGRPTQQDLLMKPHEDTVNRIREGEQRQLDQQLQQKK